MFKIYNQSNETQLSFYTDEIIKGKEQYTFPASFTCNREDYSMLSDTIPAEEKDEARLAFIADLLSVTVEELKQVIQNDSK